MAADVSRVRMDPLRDHAGVGLQQGRVLPDSDLNELVDIVDRRLRAQAADQRPANVAQVSRQTPDAFKITAEGDGLTIGPGRIYVDGLLAENHGNPANVAFDPVLAEPTFDDSIDYRVQPYWQKPDDLPGGDGPHLAYLDVWQRELTYLNAPHLVEPAIGVDTTTRTQTVWQVRLLSNVGAEATCGGIIEGWDELIAPSPARLTTGTVPVDPANDPYCELPPTGGYRGPENHLYRVELHDADGDGDVEQFKWSRDNASSGSQVVQLISVTKLRLSRLRRDDLIGFADNDWVEIVDDRRELGRRSGDLRQIVSVDEATRTISFEPALLTDLIPRNIGDDTVTGRHFRVIRWDGVAPLPGPHTAVELEHGITVEFGDEAGRAGDYWVFAARTNDASIEALTAAPPRGIHHHYARLALVFSDGARDCRPSDFIPQLHPHLVTIAGLSPADKDLIQYRTTSPSASAYTNRTPAQVKADLAIGPAEVGPNWYRPGYVSGQYYLCNSQTGALTDDDLGYGTLRVSPWIVHAELNLAGLWAEFTAVGSIGRWDFRLGIYADNNGKPGTLLIAARPIGAGPDPRTVEVSAVITLQPGMYWVGGAVHILSTPPGSQPTMRTANPLAIPSFMPLGAALPPANSVHCGYTQTGVSGELPREFTPPQPGLTNSVPRIGFRVA